MYGQPVELKERWDDMCWVGLVGWIPDVPPRSGPSVAAPPHKPAALLDGNYGLTFLILNSTKQHDQDMVWERQLVIDDDTKIPCSFSSKKG